MLLCREVRRDPVHPGLFDVLGVFDRARVSADASFPTQMPDARVFLQLAGVRGEGTARITIREADTDALVYRGPDQVLKAPPDPLATRVLALHVQNWALPRRGLSWVQFCYNEEVVAQEPLLVR
jgi:hypothetical protein